MLNPNIGKLIENYDNRYRLVIDVAHEARNVAKKVEESGDILIEKPVSIAIDKLACEVEEK
ncbi:MAG: DNA-directed RNA polymerase subunit omega [Clostridia bacterium]|nr:DNA-directed RNA polymerase subunit omega [Clostridia bacterium]MBQ2237112.1 DNA-directed RNA polymerase subunit omega [Clostridia bacterium]MEE1185570.1 DNA-directed RNA polymerase subunit omega [Acutalibacteraceae bacterium]